MDFSKYFKIISDAIEFVEKNFFNLDSAEKRQKAIENINALIDIPFLPESIEEKIIGYLIDGMVFILNKLVGKDWGAEVE